MRGVPVDLAQVLPILYLPMVSIWVLAHRGINARMSRHNRSGGSTMCRWDDYAPFLPQAAYLYFSGFILGNLAFIPLVVSPSSVQIAAGYFAQFAVSLSTYWLYPCRTERPELDLISRPSRLLDVFHRFSKPYNAFPSMHASFCLFSGLWVATYVPVWMGAPVIVWALAVVASTVLTKEHSLLDALGGSALGLVSYGLVR
jgi:membrane-associated phospholipid phosphatase